MGVRFAIEDWAAIAPGLHAPTEWRVWARAPWRPEGPLEAKLEAMPPMQRRRLTPLGRAAAQVAWSCHAPATQMPVVLASGYGDAQRCLRLLQEFAATRASSPTDFTLSVHNAIGAIYSICRGDTANYTSVAAGPASAAAGLVEACALLADGADKVLLVCYEVPLPDEYAGFQNQPAASFAWAWLLAPARPAMPHFELAWTADPRAAAGEALPFGLQALRFAISDDAAASCRAAGRRWTWTRHA